MENKILNIPMGGMWEYSEFEIQFNYNCSSLSGAKPCKHCHTIEDDNRFINEKSWVCPKVVIAANEGGYNSTGVCLDCIIEAAKENGLINT